MKQSSIWRSAGLFAAALKPRDTATASHPLLPATEPNTECYHKWGTGYISHSGHRLQKACFDQGKPNNITPRRIDVLDCSAIHPEETLRDGHHVKPRSQAPQQAVPIPKTVSSEVYQPLRAGCQMHEKSQTALPAEKSAITYKRPRAEGASRQTAHGDVGGPSPSPLKVLSKNEAHPGSLEVGLPARSWHAATATP